MTDRSDNSETDYRVIETSVIDPITHVRFYDETAEKIAKAHPELEALGTSLEHAIKDTIENPTEVRQSNVEIHTNSYKFCSNNHLKGNNPFVVAVKAVEGTSGLVKTAYFTDSITGESVWRPGND